MTRSREPAPIAAIMGLTLAALLLGCGADPKRPATSAAAREPSRGFETRGAAASIAIAFVEAQVGRPYCWGGTGPRCFDCSGLVQAAWRSAGARIPRTTGAQRDALAQVPLDQLQPGDILYWSGHVGLYVGHGELIDALNARSGVVRRPLRLAHPERALRP